jgi:hypothetical protein
MALKKKITKAEYEKLNEVFKAEYIEDGDGFRLDVDGEEDTGALKRAKDREAQLRKDAEKALKEAQDQLDALGSDDARKKGDIETLEKSWKAKLEAEQTAHTATKTKFQGVFKKNLVDAKATEIATKISKVPSLLARVIKDRLTVDFDGDEPVTKVLDANGQPSALTLEDLQKELVANADYADIIIASKASGGAGKPTAKGGGAPANPGGNADKPVDLASMNPKDLAAHIEAKKAAESET